MGFRSAEELKNASPVKRMKTGALEGCRVDMRKLYAFRCAVYFITERKRDHKPLKWRSWKEKKYVS